MSCRGAACGTAFRLRHCPACSAVPVEPLHAEAGRSPRVPCRPSVQWGLHRFACKRRVDTVSFASTLQRSTLPEGPVTGSRARRCPSVGHSCARLCKTSPDGSFTLRERGPPTVWRRPSGGVSLPSSLRPRTGRRGKVPPACDSYLVDPASSHMLVSKTKPCMSKYKRFYTVKLRMAH